ncbi:MAG TPA: BON domain-containing protein [Gemmataceae bacterium]|jgi:hypothetical protein|nr:BON domain-containing protein [Gemmataceae bacterium]
METRTGPPSASRGAAAEHAPPGPEFWHLLRSFGVSATLVPAGRGVVLEGRAATYYGKQMAQEIARRAALVVVSNRIRVGRPTPDSPRARSGAVG